MKTEIRRIPIVPACIGKIKSTLETLFENPVLRPWRELHMSLTSKQALQVGNNLYIQKEIQINLPSVHIVDAFQDTEQFNPSPKVNTYLM